MVYNFFDKKSKGGGVNIPLDFNQQLAEESHKTIIRNLKKRTVYSRFKDNIWGANLADMQLISKFNKRFRFLLCVIDIFSKYAWVVPLKDKEGVSIVNAFQKILHDSNRVKQSPKDSNLTKCGLTKEVNFTIALLKNG